MDRTVVEKKPHFIGMDVHRETISVAVLDGEGWLLMQSVLATRAASILDFVGGVRETLQVIFEEGTRSAWLHDLLLGRVAKLVVCNPRKNALLKSQQERCHRRTQGGGVAGGGPRWRA